MNVLSLFDGHSGAMISLEAAEIKVDKYYSSEIDKHAQKASNACYPDIIRMGDVKAVSCLSLGKIDILLGGSPCQSFSFAGKRKGMSTKCEVEILDLGHYLQLKSENFEFEGQSFLFWEYMRILKELQQVNPDVYFFLENVEMGAKWENVISKAIGVKGIHINSALVSAQNRRRIYWTNIGMEPGGLFGELESKIQQPKDRGILLKDILENEVDEKYYLSDKAVSGIIAHKAVQKEKGFGFGAVIKESHEKMNALKCGGKGVDDLVRTESICLKEVRSSEAKAIRKENRSQGIDSNPYRAKDVELRNDGKTGALLTAPTDMLCVAMRGRGENNEQQLEPRNDNKTNAITSVQKDNLIICHNTMPRDVIQLNQSKESGRKQPYQQNRVYSINGISPCLDTGSGRKNIEVKAAQKYVGYRQEDKLHISSDKFHCSCAANGGKVRGKGLFENSRIRRLTPRECGRLQTIPEQIIDKILSSGVSDSQIYKMFGNGWNIETIVHILKYIK